MGAVRSKALADLRRRRLQAIVIALVVFLASGAATLALNVLVESHAPFERAFAAANGAHLVIDFDGTTDPATLAATSHAAGVTASAGPWPVTVGVVTHPKGGLIGGQQLSGRPAPDASIDSVSIISGRWWTAPGEVVLDQDMADLLDRQVGDAVDFFPAPQVAAKGGLGGGSGVTVGPAAGPPSSTSADVGPHTLTIVGIAASVSTPDVAAWMSPQDIAALSPGRVPNEQMLYRVDDAAAATTATLTAERATIVAGVPQQDLASSTTYLDVSKGVDRLADLYVPILLAFSVFALLAAAFSIANVVGGIVLTRFREIGVMKAIGFTPGQVTSILLVEILVPVAIGAVLGTVAGTLGSTPIIQQTAQSFGLPGVAAFSAMVVAAVLAIALLMAFVAAIGPAIRAGRLSAVAAMSRGAAPSARPGGGMLRRAGLRLPLALPVRLGVAAGVSHPGRAAMTLGALVVGVAAATFAIGMNASLLRVMEDINRAAASPVRVELAQAVISPADMTTAIRSDVATARSVSIGETQVTVPLAGTIPFVGYADDSSWLGYALISGRWFTGPGEAVAPTNFFTVTGLSVGDSVTVTQGSHSIAVRLVGEVFVTNEGDGLVLQGTWSDLATLQPGIEPSSWEIQPVAGADTASILERMRAIAPGVDVYRPSDGSNDRTFLLFLAVIGTLGVVLVTISLGGVFNTVLMETRQRTRELAVLKAVGFTPFQVIGLVVASIAPVGLLAGLIGVPIGLGAQHVVLAYMGQVAAKTNIPPSVFDVFGPVAFVGLGLAGLAIGIVGAWIPAQRAALARIAPVLQAE